MARKKGMIAELKKYGNNHPFVTLALAGTFSYYLYENMSKSQAVLQPTAAPTKKTLAWDNKTALTMDGLGASTSTTSSTKSGLFGLGATSVRPMQETQDFINKQSITKVNPPSFLKYDQTQQLSGFSPSARRRVGHAGIGMVSDSYSPKLDTQFSNREAMITGDLKKHADILGFSGLAPLAGGDWYE